MHSSSHLSALRYFNLDLWSIVGSRRHVLDLPYDEETVDDATENDVFLVEEVAFCAGDEKLKKEESKSWQGIHGDRQRWLQLHFFSGASSNCSKLRSFFHF